MEDHIFTTNTPTPNKRFSFKRPQFKFSRLAQFVLVVGLVGSTLFFANRIRESQAPERSKAQEVTSRELRVLEIAYWPRTFSSIGDTAIWPDCELSPRDPNLFTLFHPTCTSATLQSGIQDGSKYKNIFGSNVIGGIARPVNNGTRIDIEGSSPGGADWYAGLQSIFQNNNVCQLIEQNQLDQIWLYFDVGHDTGSFNQEYFISWPISDPALAEYPTLCPGNPRVVSVLAFDMNRQPDLASYGHFVEEMLATTQGPELFWQKFAGKAYPGRLRDQYPVLPGFEESKLCGNDHYPPNTSNAYIYNDPATVSNICEDWHPDGTGATSSVTCDKWHCNAKEYFVWWLQRMPGYDTGMTYNNQALPAWHSFFADTANTIQRYFQEGKWVYSDAFRRIGLDTATNEVTVQYVNQEGTTVTWTQSNTAATGTLTGGNFTLDEEQ